MAIQPWVTPQEVKAYTEYPTVQSREDTKLQVDIARAEQYVVLYTNNQFGSMDAVPPTVKTAVILIAEAYAFNSCVAAREIKSETFDDYSYTAETQSINIEALDIKPLLDGYVVTKATGNTTLRLRRL